MDYTPKAFFNKLAGFYQLETQREQANWERSRWMAAVIINPHTKKNIKPIDLGKFSWEKDNQRAKKQLTSKEDIQSAIRKIEAARKFKTEKKI